MKRILCMLIAATLVFSAAYIGVSATNWTYDYIGLNEFPEDIADNPEACYVDGFAMLYTHEIAGDRFSYENGKLTPLDSSVLRYNWFIVFEPVSGGYYKATYAGNNIVAGEKSVPISEDGIILAFNYWEGDGRISCAPFYEAYLYALDTAAADLYNDFAVPKKDLWAEINEEFKTAVLTDISLEIDGDESTPVSEAESTPVSEAESTPVSEAESTPVSEAESTPVSEAESTPVSEAESTNTSEEASTPAAASSATSEASEDESGFPWVWVIVGVVVVAAAAAAVVLIKKKKA